MVRLQVGGVTVLELAGEGAYVFSEIKEKKFYRVIIHMNI